MISPVFWAIVLKAVIVVLVFSILIIVHEFGHFFAAVKCGVRVEVFSLGFGRKIFSRRRRDTEFSLSAIPVGGYVQLAGDNAEAFKGNDYEYLAKPVHKRLSIIAAGPIMNFVLGFCFLWVVYLLGYPVLFTHIGGVANGYGAQEAGLKIGDTIVSVEGSKVETWGDLQMAIERNRNKQTVTIMALRDARLRGFTVKLRLETIKDANGKEILDTKGNLVTIPRIGVSPGRGHPQILEAAFLAGKRTYQVTVITYKALWYMVIGKLSVKESVAGPVGIVDIISKMADQGLAALVHLVAVLSLSLGIFNLLPLPALDGGHIALLGVEKIRGKNLSKQAEDIFTRIGFGFLIAVAVLVTFNDLARKGVFDKGISWATHLGQSAGKNSSGVQK